MKSLLLDQVGLSLKKDACLLQITEYLQGKQMSIVQSAVSWAKDHPNLKEKPSPNTKDRYLVEGISKWDSKTLPVLLTTVTVRTCARSLFLPCFSWSFKPLSVWSNCSILQTSSAIAFVPVPQWKDAIVRIVDALIFLCSKIGVLQGPENTSGHQINTVNLPFYLERQK